MSRHTENTGFTGALCGHAIEPLTTGRYRNHCPFCLHSLHVDIMPGDRHNTCHGLMEPLKVRSGKKGFQIVFRCKRCGTTNVNRIAEHTQQPDDIDRLVAIMHQRPFW